MKMTKNAEVITPYDEFGCECLPGWYGLIYPIIFDIEEYNKTHPNDQIKIFQIKEKLGELCIHLDNAPERIKEKARKAEELSMKICEVCGSPIDVTTYIKNRWIRTRCKNCKI